MAPHLEHYIGPWCAALRSVRDDVEKEHAFLGLAALLRINPLVSTAWPAYCVQRACQPGALLRQGHRWPLQPGMPLGALRLPSACKKHKSVTEHSRCWPLLLLCACTGSGTPIACRLPHTFQACHGAWGLRPAACAQGALKGWVPLCEALVSWHIIRCDGLRHDLIQLMQAFKGNLAKVRLLRDCALLCSACTSRVDSCCCTAVLLCLCTASLRCFAMLRIAAGEVSIWWPQAHSACCI